MRENSNTNPKMMAIFPVATRVVKKAPSVPLWSSSFLIARWGPVPRVRDDPFRGGGDEVAPCLLTVSECRA